MAKFMLSKWYADCANEQGDAMILCSAELNWRGPYHRQAAYYNGAAVPIREIDDHKIALADGNIVLSLEKKATLREGLLGATALLMLPNLNRLFPARILKVREQKWLSRGVLRHPGRPDSAGMAIHEVVEWP
jgi:hypothetical protein